MGAVGGRHQRAAADARWTRGRRPGRRSSWRRLGHKPRRVRHGMTQCTCVSVCVCVCYRSDATASAGVAQVAMQQLCGAILKGLGQSSEQHRELRRVQLKQGNQHHLGCLRIHPKREKKRHTLSQLLLHFCLLSDNCEHTIFLFLVNKKAIDFGVIYPLGGSAVSDTAIQPLACFGDIVRAVLLIQHCDLNNQAAVHYLEHC